jgi:transposase-like protein
MPRSLPAPVARALRQPRWSATDARLILDALASSRLAVSEFSREYGVDPQRLYVWRRRLNATEAPLTFVQLQDAQPAPAATTRYELLLPGGEILRIEGNVIAPDVAVLLAALRGARPC